MIKLSIFVLSLCFLANNVNAEWSTMMRLFNPGGTIKHYNVYSDANGTSHVAYCEESTSPMGDTRQSLHYAQYDDQNELVSEYKFPINSGCRFVKIAGYGKEVTIVFEGQREFRLAMCNETNPGGCYDIYITTSLNAGKSWLPIMSVGRTKVNDTVERLSPSIVYNQLTGRSYVFYTYREISTVVTRMTFATKPPDSVSFSFEKITQYEVKNNIIDTLITTEGMRSIVHIYIDNGEDLTHVYTKNGIVWEQEQKSIKDSTFTKFYSTGRNPVICGVYTDGTESYLVNSFNHGMSWEDPIRIRKTYHRVSGGVLYLSKNTEQYLILILTNFMQTNATFVYTKIAPKQTEFIKGRMPFSLLKNYGIFMPQIVHTTYEDRTGRDTYKAFAYVWGNGTEPAIYVSDYKYIPL